MSIEGFGYKEQFIGTSDTSVYTFDFKIFKPSHLQIYVQDQFGNIVEEIDGDDQTFLSGVTFDPIKGGGTVNLANVLANANVMTIFLANDYPDQPSQFPNKTSFTFEAIEGALDFLATCVQRVAYLAQRSIRLHDLDDIDNFDMRLPMNLSASPFGIITVNSDGTGFAVGNSFADLIKTILQAQTAALASEAIAAAAATGATASLAQATTAANASTNAAAQSQAALAAIQATLAAVVIPVHAGPFAAIAPNTNSNLSGEVTNSTLFTMVEYVARIKRGNAVYARQQFTIFFRNSAWEISIGPDAYADAGADHGVTFTVDSVTGQINAAVANDGGSNAIIDISKINWTV